MSTIKQVFIYTGEGAVDLQRIEVGSKDDMQLIAECNVSVLANCPRILYFNRNFPGNYGRRYPKVIKTSDDKCVLQVSKKAQNTKQNEITLLQGEAFCLDCRLGCIKRGK